jgi:sigma-B regulation protein RsbU (phosphoserine phosphatase)
VLVANAAGGGWDTAGIDTLSTVANLSAAAVQNAVLYRNAIEHERISAEMKLASDVQASMLPGLPPTRPGVELAGWNIPCDETGGDYYDFLDMGDGRTGIVIGDATGHGMGAALMMFVVRSSLRALLTQRHDLVSIMATMNDLVEESSASHRFMTFFFGVVDEEARLLTYTNAGHDPPLVYRPSTGEFLELSGTGVPLGVLPGSQYGVDTAPLRPGDLWIFGTDGIWEARNASGEFFGKERLQELTRSISALSVEEASRRLREEVVAFHGGAEQRDDITAVLMRVLS